MINIYPRNSILICKAENGFIVNTKGSIEHQEDGLDGVHVFEKIEDMNAWIKEFYNKWK